jgi:hypothetical protein
VETRTALRSSWLGFALLSAVLISFFALAAGQARAAIGDGPALPSVSSDKADYAPGELVTLSGANWAAGESVHVVVNDDAGQSWRYENDATAAADGTFSMQFNLPDWFVAVYTVTATGATSGIATWSFTDGNVTLRLPGGQGATSITVAYEIFGSPQTQNNTCSGSASSSGQIIVPSGGSANVPGFGNQNLSVRLGEVTSTPIGKTIDFWSSGTKTADSNPLVSLGETPCISAAGSGTNGNVTDAYAHLKDANSAPTCSNGSATTAEDTPTALTLSCSDVDGDALTYSIVSGPSNGTLSGTGAGRTYTPAADYNGGDSFTFQANDGTVDSNVATFSLTITPVNDAPTCSNGSATTAEDTPTALTLSCSDVDGDALTYSIVSGPSNGTLSGTGASRTYNPNGNYNGSDSFTFQANDGTIDSNVATFSLTITPVDDPPTVTRDDASVTVDEGDTAVNSGTFGDVDGDTVTLSASVGTVTAHPDGTWDWSFGTSDGPDESQTVTITASDGAPPNATATFDLTVKNVAPAVSAGADQEADEGTSTSFALGSFTDPGEDGPWQVSVDWGDGSPVATFTKSAPGSLGSLSHTYADGPATHTVAVTVAEVGSAPTPSGSDSFQVTVKNVAPAVTLTGEENVAEGSTHTYTFTVTDPGDDTFSVSLGYPTCGTGGTVVDGSLATTASGGSFDCTFPDGPATTNVAIKVADSDGASDTDSEDVVIVTVSNVKPVVEAAADQSSDEGENKSFSLGSFSDPGPDAPWAVDVNWGDGSAHTTFNASATGSLASKSHAYGDDDGNPFTVTVTVTDTNGDSGSATFQATVANVDPTALNPTFVFNPVVGTATAGFDFADAGWLDTHAASFFTWSAGAPSGSKTVTEENVAPDATGTASENRIFAPGCYNLTVTGTAKDDDGGMSAALSIFSGAQTGVYANAFRPPIMDNERNIAKYGNVVPIKVTLTNPCTGGTVTNVALYVQVIKGVGGEYIEDNNVVVESVSAADTGQQMRVADGMYIYNLSTKSLTANSDYAVRIRMGSLSGPMILQAVLYPKK